MAIVALVDFGTLSVRVSLVDSGRGLIASAVSEYPLHHKKEDPEFATQSHDDHMRALAAATRAGGERLQCRGTAGITFPNGRLAWHHKIGRMPSSQTAQVPGDKLCSTSCGFLHLAETRGGALGGDIPLWSS